MLPGEARPAFVEVEVSPPARLTDDGTAFVRLPVGGEGTEFSRSRDDGDSMHHAASAAALSPVASERTMLRPSLQSGRGPYRPGRDRVRGGGVGPRRGRIGVAGRWRSSFGRTV